MKVLSKLRSWWGFQMKLMYLHRIRRDEENFQKWMVSQKSEIDLEVVDIIDSRIKRLTERQRLKGIN
jgi:hypothetical protein